MSFHVVFCPILLCICAIAKQNQKIVQFTHPLNKIPPVVNNLPISPKLVFSLILQIKKLLKSIHPYLFIICSWLLIQSAFASDDYYFRTIRMKDGLPGSTINTIVQDSLGFLWIGTNDGLCRYDGAGFRIFRHHNYDTTSLSHNDIQNLFIDQEQNLWVMTANGLNLIDLKTHKISRVIPGNNSLTDNSTIAMAQAPDGTYFAASYYNGISIFEELTGQFSYLTDTLSDGATLRSLNINDMLLYNDSLLIIGYRDAGVDLYNIHTRQISSLLEETGGRLPSDHVSSLAAGLSDRIWIGTNNGIACYDVSAQELWNFIPGKKQTDFVVDRDIVSLEAFDGKLWIGTRNEGLVVVNEKDILSSSASTEFTHYKPGLDPGSLSYRTVSVVFHDNRSQVWIGTHGGGINFAETSGKRFGHLRNVPGTAKTLSYDKVWGITADDEGHVWAGTDGDGVNVWKPGKGVIAHYRNVPGDATSLSDNAVISAFTDQKGRVWLGTYQGGLNRFVKETESFIRYQAPDHLPVNDVRTIYEDPFEKLWVGLNQGGVLRYDEENDTFRPAPNLEMYDVREIYYHGENLWIGTYGQGLIRYNPETAGVQLYNTWTEPTPFPFHTIFSITSLPGEDNVIWLGSSDGGLFAFNTENEEFNEFSETDGLSNNKIHAILPDSDGNLWMSTNKGISMFDTQRMLFNNYDWNRGVQSEEFHNGSAVITGEGLFCFGGIEGMNYFRPENIRSPNQKPRIRFTGFSILNRDVTPMDSDIFDKAIEYRPNIQLNHKHSVFTIHFQSLNYPFAWDSKYLYYLEGYDKEWNDAGRQNFVTYRNLPPGDYTFRVRSYTFDSGELYDESALQISMAPPYWKTGIAYGLYVVVALMGVVTYIRYRVNRYKIKNRLLYEQKLRDEEKKLHEERLEFFTNISHELRTPLTIIGVALEEIGKTNTAFPDIKKPFESAVKNSNRLRDLINKILEFRQMETGDTHLMLSKIPLRSFLSEYIEEFREMARHNKIRLKLSLPLEEIQLWADQDKLNMILNNLFSNAFKNTPTGGQIILSADERDEHVIIKVKDTGVGIEKKNLQKIFRRYYKLDNKATSSGIGLALTRSLVELHKGTIEVDSTPGKGTTFLLRFKKGTAHLKNQQEMELTEDQTDKKEFSGSLPDVDSDSRILLIIDDNKEIVDLLEERFNEEFKVLKAFEANKGLQLARGYSPDLIISDVMMPGMDGFELCKNLKNEHSTSHIPVILLTAKGSETDEIQGLETGADDYISKPFKFGILKARVNSLLENRKKIQDYFGNPDGASSENLAAPALPDREIEFLSKVEKYVLEHCLDTEVSVFDLARGLGFSRTTLYRKIKALTGMSINAFVRSIKIKESTRLIGQGMNVSEAAYSIGFTDLKYFRESFKKQVGKNPSEFKN